MSLLTQFIQEYDHLYYKNLGKENTGDILQEIKQVEKIINMPKLHPTQEIKQFYKQLRENYKNPLNIQIVGDCNLTMIAFINVLFKDSLIPLHNGLAQKKIILRFSQYYFTRAHYKHGSIDVDLHTLDCSASNLEEIEYFEIFIPNALLQECIITKESDFSNKKTLNAIKDSDCILWVICKPEKLKKEELIKIIKKKPTIATLSHENKEKENHEILEQISTHRKQLVAEYNLNTIYDINIWNLLESYKLDEKFAICKIISTLHKQQLTGKVRSMENTISSLTQAQTLIESFYAQKKKTGQTTTEHTIIQSIIDSLQSIFKTAYTKRGINTIKAAFEKNKSIDKHYKLIFEHYKKLDSMYHKANESLIAKTRQLITEYNREIFVTIAKGLKKYLDSIVESILDNVETIKIKTRPNHPNFIDILTNRRIIYDSFQLHREELIQEISDSKSLLARKHKNLLTKLSRLDSYITQSMQNIMQTFEQVLHEWIERGHRLILQKKPNYISTDSYVSLEEFQLGIFHSFTKKHRIIINDFINQVHTHITTLNVWCQATKTMLLECIILRIEQKFHADKSLVKQTNKANNAPLDSDFLQDCIIELLPERIEQIFCHLPTSNTLFDTIPNQLLQEAKNNEKIVRNRIKDIIDLRQTLKIGTKILEKAIDGENEVEVLK